MSGIKEVLANVRQWHVETADVLEGLRQIPDETVQCCVTSPPYFALRDYGCDGQIGLESTPAAYVAKLVEVFTEVRRVLRSDGTCWMNIGDSYSTDTKWGGSSSRKNEAKQGYAGRYVRTKSGCKPKDLIGVPWLLAFALRDDGWYLRQEIIWHKPAPMPESVTDRCTKAHETIFLLTKSARYFYDQEAVREPQAESTLEHFKSGVERRQGIKHGSVPGGSTHLANESYKTSQAILPNGRNKRTVWTLTQTPYAGAHFATFPVDLPLTCLKAGTPARGQCAECGSPWERTIESERVKTRPGTETKLALAAGGTLFKDSDKKKRFDELSDIVGNRDPYRHVTTKVTTGWQATCKCGQPENPADGIAPCVCLDPFSGAGTTGVAAKSLGLRYIGLELNPDYAEMSRRRIDRGLVEDAPKQPKSLAGQRDLFA